MSDGGYWVTTTEYRRITKPDRIAHARAVLDRFSALLGRMQTAGFGPQTFALYDGGPGLDLADTLKAIGKELNQALRDAGPGTQAAERDIAAIESALDQFIRSKERTCHETRD